MRRLMLTRRQLQIRRIELDLNGSIWLAVVTCREQLAGGRFGQTAEAVRALHAAASKQQWGEQSIVVRIWMKSIPCWAVQGRLPPPAAVQ